MDDPVIKAIGFVVFLFSVVVHENAHGVAAEYFGDPTARQMGRITMNPVPHIDPVGSILFPLAAIFIGIPFIGWAKPVPVNSYNLRNPIVHNAYVAAAGPASNFLLAFVGVFIWVIALAVFNLVPGLDPGSKSLVFFRELAKFMIQFNILLAVFNLLPIPPLDGHWILMRYLPPGPREALASVGRFGFMILLVLLWTNILWAVIGPPMRLITGLYFGLANALAGLV